MTIIGTRRPFLILLFGVFFLWLVLEWFLFGLVSGSIGVFPTIVLAIGKGGLGLLLLGFVLRRFSRSMRDGASKGPKRLLEPGLAILGAILICLPGFLASLVGLALFAPSFRALVLGWGKRHAPPDIIDLGQGDYHEVRRGP